VVVWGTRLRAKIDQDVVNAVGVNMVATKRPETAPRQVTEDLWHIGWQMHVDQEGNFMHYYDRTTKRSQYEFPESAALAACKILAERKRKKVRPHIILEQTLAPGWSSGLNREGEMYYYDKKDPRNRTEPKELTLEQLAKFHWLDGGVRTGMGSIGTGASAQDGEHRHRMVMGGVGGIDSSFGWGSCDGDGDGD